MNQTWGQKASLLLQFLYKLYNAPSALPIYIYNRLCPWKFISPRVLNARTFNLCHNIFFLACLRSVLTMASSTTRRLGLNGGMMGLIE